MMTLSLRVLKFICTTNFRFYTILNQILVQLDLNDDKVFSNLKEREYFAKSRQTVLALSVLRDALIERRKKV